MSDGTPSELPSPARSWRHRALWGAHRGPSTFALSRWTFLRLLGVIHLVAFVSLRVQILGLIGSDGILPVEPFLPELRASWGIEAYRIFPTVLWFGASDTALVRLCDAGALVSLLLIVDVAPAVMSALLWIGYLSLLSACRVFLGYQWDILLLEVTFLAIFIAPLTLRPRRPRAGDRISPAVRWLFFLLAFRLMFSSGVVKLTSGDPVWRDLTALTLHYETQPLPTWTAWYAHQLPVWLHQASCAVMFAVELIAPLFVFAPRRPRAIAALAMMGLMALIAATGNYTYFNLLTVAVLLLLIDDAAWPARLRDRLLAAPAERSARRWPHIVIAAVAALLVLLNAVQLADTLRVHRGAWPLGIDTVVDKTRPLRLVNGYGLFAVMTKTRPEIVLEGSRDGLTWQAYGFWHKPGDPKRAPSFVAPHQPRIDWQMWFASLGDYRGNYWLMSMMRKLLDGSPTVLALLETNPFPNAPPRHIRAVLYDYRFTNAKTRRATGRWWRRIRAQLYAPVLSRR